MYLAPARSGHSQSSHSRFLLVSGLGPELSAGLRRFALFPVAASPLLFQADRATTGDPRNVSSVPWTELNDNKPSAKTGWLAGLVHTVLSSADRCKDVTTPTFSPCTYQGLRLKNGSDTVTDCVSTTWLVTSPRYSFTLFYRNAGPSPQLCGRSHRPNHLHQPA